MKDIGSSVVEVSLVMPVILGILILILNLFLDTVQDSMVQQEGYSILYSYEEKKLKDAWQGYKSEDEVILDAEEQGVGFVSGNKIQYHKQGHTFITEVDICSKRLRRWQLYGNIIWE